MSHLSKIVAYCQENRVSTTEVSDAISKSGVLGTFTPLIENQYVAGPIRCVFTANGSNHQMHAQLTGIEPGDVVVIFAEQCENRAILGQLVAKYALLYKQAAALVVFGMIRDRAALLRDGARIWSQGFTPLGCTNEPVEPFPEAAAALLREKYQGGVAVCDSGGVAFLESCLINEETLNRLKWIEAQEDLWFYCLDTLKWSTDDIVCQRRYLTEPGEIPSALLTPLTRALESTRK